VAGDFLLERIKQSRTHRSVALSTDVTEIWHGVVTAFEIKGFRKIRTKNILQMKHRTCLRHGAITFCLLNRNFAPSNGVKCVRNFYPLLQIKEVHTVSEMFFLRKF
jgi:hypothetical protein